MLLKIESIEEIGRFATLKHKAPQFGALTLIFARNGYGKSTLCSILRSAAEQDGFLISARRRLGALGASLANTQWKKHGAVKFSAGAWNSCPGPVHIFDAEYVHRNLHVAESVTRDNKRSLINVIFGDQGVKLAKAVSDLDAEQKALATEQSASERTIKTLCPVVSDVARFVAADIPTDIDQQVAAAEQAVELAQQATAVKDRRSFAEIDVKALADYEAIASRDVAGITDDAADRVKAHLDLHKLHPHGERWVKYGVEHMEGASCPFCTQDTSGVEIVQIFRGFFSQAYASLMADTEAALSGIQDLLKKDVGLSARLDDHAADLNFWGRVCDIGAPPLLDNDARERIVDALKSLQQLLEQKLSNPLVKGQLANRASVSAALAELTTYLGALEACGPTISDARASSATAELDKARTTLAQLKGLRAKLTGPLKDECDAWAKRAKRRQGIETEKKQAQDALKAYVSTTTDAKQNAINEILELFGASFKISGTKASFVGREANTDYSIAVGPHLVPAGERDRSKPSFNTVLSAGDKFTLALAFFLTQVKDDPNLADATIVFDDPFSSLDAHREWETTSQLRAVAKQACQVIVLSHDPRFLALIEKNERSTIDTFQITCDDTGSGEIRPWSSADELRDLYLRQCERIREYASTGNLLPGVTHESLIKDLRPFVEGFVRNRYPGRFAHLVMLDGMTDEIEKLGTADPMFPHVRDLRALNEYGRDNMHAGAPPPDPQALRAQCRRVVKIIGSY